MTKKIALLGSTGSIGRQTLEVVDSFPGKLQVVALTAQSNVELLSAQIQRYKPKIAAIGNKALLPALKAMVGNTATIILGGAEGILAALDLAEVNMVVAAISGAAGLVPTITAIKLGKDIALANKESLVAAGHYVTAEAQKKGVNIIPVDSEHSAVFQCIQNNADLLEGITLTASGGPFRGWPKRQLQDVTPAMALKHPNWAMGAKITVDSATMINKGLEVIEAHWLFNLPYSQIEVVIHPQSVIHSLVTFTDGSILAQMGLPDMRLPIQYALTWPARWNNNLQRLDLAKVGQFTFEKPDYLNFPGLKLAYEVGASGGTAPCIFNAANEAAVRLFLQEKIGFMEIIAVIEYCLERMTIIDNPTLEEVLATDAEVRKRVTEKYS